MFKKIINNEYFKIAIMTFFIGLSIILFLYSWAITVMATDLRDEVIEKNKQIEEYKISIDDINQEKERLKMENDELWDLYYNCVSNYEGEYKYYE